jgi:hypothetical protein
MKKLLALLIFVPFSAIASPPFSYKTNCYVENDNKYYEDVCTVVETREEKGFLKTRNVYSNKFGLTVKLRWDGKQFLTWDSHNKYEYKWEYKLGNVPMSTQPHTYIMPGVLLESVSYD